MSKSQIFFILQLIKLCNVAFAPKLSKLVTDPLCLDSPVEAGELWEQVRREKAAGGYPWTHLSHNEEEEVWINPLKLPVDISRWERIAATKF